MKFESWSEAKSEIFKTYTRKIQKSGELTM